MADKSASPDKTLMSVAFIKRKPELTVEQFYDHWANVHGPLVKPWAQRFGLIGYTQVHLKPELNTVAPIGPESKEESPLAGYDGCAIMEISNFDQFAEAFKDDYYVNQIAADEAKFIDKKVGVVRARGEVNRVI
ncbi:EthD domain-containing protein [Xylariaceae sp. FL1019]|nr:EthD domain-containing protein [Xylariaceae sp. FL1019]